MMRYAMLSTFSVPSIPSMPVFLSTFPNSSRLLPDRFTYAPQSGITLAYFCSRNGEAGMKAAHLVGPKRFEIVDAEPT